MLIDTRHRGPYATVVLTGSSEDTTALALSSQLCRLLEEGATTIVLDVREAPHVEPAVAEVAARFHHLCDRLGGSLRVEPPWEDWVHPVLPVPRVPERSRHDAGASPWFG